MNLDFVQPHKHPNNIEFESTYKSKDLSSVWSVDWSLRRMVCSSDSCVVALENSFLSSSLETWRAASRS